MSIGMCKKVAKLKITKLDKDLKEANKRIKELELEKKQLARVAKLNIVQKNIQGANKTGGMCNCERCIDSAIVDMEPKSECSRATDSDNSSLDDDVFTKYDDHNDGGAGGSRVEHKNVLKEEALKAREEGENIPNLTSHGFWRRNSRFTRGNSEAENMRLQTFMEAREAAYLRRKMEEAEEQEFLNSVFQSTSSEAQEEYVEPKDEKRDFKNDNLKEELQMPKEEDENHGIKSENFAEDPQSPEEVEYLGEKRKIPIGEKRKIPIVTLDEDSDESSVVVLNDPRSPDEDTDETFTDVTELETSMDDEVEGQDDDGYNTEEDKKEEVMGAQGFTNEEEVVMDESNESDGEVAKIVKEVIAERREKERRKEQRDVEADLSQLVHEIANACENLHLMTLKDVQAFSIRLNQLELRNDGLDEEINRIVDTTHGELQFIVDSVTEDSVFYMAVGDGIAGQENIDSDEEEDNDAGPEADGNDGDDERGI